jgi:TRAP-type mannitol/chloroaromatic compound transport system permease large subunit
MYVSNSTSNPAVGNNNTTTSTSNPAVSNTNNSSNPATTTSSNNSNTNLSEKKLRRLEKNRLSARECRRRKREATEDMEQEIFRLEAENLKLRLQLRVRMITTMLPSINLIYVHVDLLFFGIAGMLVLLL